MWSLILIFFFPKAHSNHVLKISTVPSFSPIHFWPVAAVVWTSIYFELKLVSTLKKFVANCYAYAD